MESLTFPKKILAILEDMKAENVRCFDVRGTSSITDFNILATGSSSPHLRAIVSDIRARLRDDDIPSYRSSGEPESGWVVLDYLNVIVHVFTPEARAYYDLDDLWKDAPLVDADSTEA